MLSCPSDLCKFKEFIKFFISFTGGNFINIDNLTLFRRFSLYVSGLSDLNLAARFSPMLEKYLLNSSKIDCYSVISYLLKSTEVGKFDDFGDFRGSNVQSSSHVFSRITHVFFKFVWRNNVNLLAKIFYSCLIASLVGL